MKTSLFVLFFLQTLLSCSLQNQRVPEMESSKKVGIVSISVKLALKSRLTLNYINSTPPVSINFDNPSEHDSTIIGHINLDNPTEFFFLSASTGKNGTPIPVFYYLFVFPGDSIVLDSKSRSVIYSTNIANYINKLIDIPDYASLLANPKGDNNPYHKGLRFLLNTVNETYNTNKDKITILNLNKKSKEAMNKINLTEKYFQIYNMIDIDKLNSDEMIIMDSINNAVLKDSGIFNINSPEIYAIMEDMIKISAKKSGAKLNNFWNYFSMVDDNIKHLHFYEYYAFFRVIGCFFYNFDNKSSGLDNSSLQETINILAATANRNALQDSLLKFANILLDTKIDYAKAKQDLNNFYNGKYAYVFADESAANHERKNISNLMNVHLFDFKGISHDFRNVIIMDKKYKLIVVDFWASWCVPCLNEMPFYEKAKDKLKNQPIKFVGISIDRHEDTNRWIAAAKTHGLYNDPFQYRMENYNASPLTTLLQIKTIPRYIIFDNAGNVINTDLEKPSSGKFEEVILKYLE